MIGIEREAARSIARRSTWRERKLYYGACLARGRHTPGSQAARECPLLRGRISPEENDRRLGRPSAPGRSETPARPIGHGSQFETAQGEIAQADNEESATYEDNKPSRIAAPSLRSPGRPTVESSALRKKAAARQKAYRARQKSEAA